MKKEQAKKIVDDLLDAMYKGQSIQVSPEAYEKIKEAIEVLTSNK